MKVTKIATQGRKTPYFGQFVTGYTLSYSNDSVSWTEYKGEDGSTKDFVGNTDANTVVSHELPISINARYIRVVVQRWESHISMRMELYGCKS
ncbi:hypothetical protein QZH41_020035 [Actinostola sp. cb2023]|nr:hypothetical protein QZH41_020035 [Actinostola sp. cb2023]